MAQQSVTEPNPVVRPGRSEYAAEERTERVSLVAMLS